jgi:hypothetical protein
VETHGKPVTGLKEVRLLHNIIIEGEGGKSRLLARGEIVSIDLVAPRWRTSEFIEAPDQYRENKVMMLHDFTCAVPNFDGERVVYRERLFSAFSLVDPASSPNRIMEGLVEGEDYLSQWDEERRKNQEYERQNATEEFSMEGPDVPSDVSDGRNVHDPYNYSL